MCDSVNHTRLPKEDHVPDWVCWDKHGNKGDRVEQLTKLFAQQAKSDLMFNFLILCTTYHNYTS